MNETRWLNPDIAAAVGLGASSDSSGDSSSPSPSSSSSPDTGLSDASPAGASVAAGELAFGAVDASRYTGGLTYTPVTVRLYWQVGMQYVKAGNTTIVDCTGGDSGGAGSEGDAGSSSPSSDSGGGADSGGSSCGAAVDSGSSLIHGPEARRNRPIDATIRFYLIFILIF